MISLDETEEHESPIKPNPGSAEAIAQGCTCPVSDNHHGKGLPYGKDGAPMFWRSTKCIVHGDRE